MEQGKMGAYILFVEDDAISRRLIEKIFRRTPHLQVDLAKNGKEALEMVKQNRYDLIFMDIQMPHLDGLQATREIRRREAAGTGIHTPVVAVSAYVAQEDRQRCQEAGMDDFLPKPIDVKGLMEAISHYSQQTNGSPGD